MSDEATIQMSRVTGREGDEDQMEVEVILDEGEKTIRVGMSLADFARALTGDFKVPCRTVRREGF